MRLIHIAIIVLVLVTIVYALSRTETLIAGPSLDVHSPAPRDTVPQFFTVDGVVTDAVYLSVNDQRVYPDHAGFFKKDLVASAGPAIIEVYARDRRGQETIIHVPLHIHTHDIDQEETLGPEEEPELTVNSRGGSR